MMFRRRKQQKTDYRQRLGLLKSGKTRVAVRRTLSNVHVQFIEYHKTGDKTVLEEMSKSLQKYGWKGHRGNISAAYLTGFLAGCEAKKRNIKEAVLDSGLQKSIKGSAVYAAALGVKDSGIIINVGSEILPDKSRISGKHIADYALKMKNDQALYKKHFSEYLKSGLAPENLTKHFDEVKGKIISEFGSAAKPSKEGKAQSKEKKDDTEEDLEEVA